MEFIPVPGYENLYAVDEIGNVKSFGMVRTKGGALKAKAPKILSQEMGLGRKGPNYWRVSLWKNGKKWKPGVHQVVALAFIGEAPEGATVNHKDGNKLNNHFSNLEYATRSENQIHAYEVGLQKRQRGAQRPMSKLTELQVLRVIETKEKVKDLAVEFGVSESLLYMLRTGSRWKHVTAQ